MNPRTRDKGVMADQTLIEIHAIEGGLTLGIYRGTPRRAASWARRANPNATLLAVSYTPKGSPHGQQ